MHITQIVCVITAFVWINITYESIAANTILRAQINQGIEHKADIIINEKGRRKNVFYTH